MGEKTALKIIDPRPPSNKNNDTPQRRLVGALARRLRPSADGGHARRRRALVPYVLVRRGVAGDPLGSSSLSAALSAPVSGDDAPDEETALATGSSRFALRFRWYRSVLLGVLVAAGRPPRRAHPDREAAISGTIVERLVRFRLIFMLMALTFSEKKTSGCLLLPLPLHRRCCF